VGTPYLDCGHTGRGRDRLDHDAFQCTLPQVTREQADQESLLGASRATE
jgi:hypothetical protein